MTVTYEVGETIGGGHLDIDFYVCLSESELFRCPAR